jgi:hypothetical protein
MMKRKINGETPSRGLSVNQVTKPINAGAKKAVARPINP